MGNRLVCMIFAILRIFHLAHGRYYYMFSRVRRASGGVGWVGVVEVITFVGTFTHIPCDMFSRDAGHLVGWVGWGGGGGDNLRWNIHTYSMLHVLQGR